MHNVYFEKISTFSLERKNMVKIYTMKSSRKDVSCTIEIELVLAHIFQQS